MKTIVTETHARKVLEIVDAGLVSGLGHRVPGQMCVEAAVCFALGEPHGDSPSCVGAAVRAFKIRLNDANWPSDQARAEGLREIAIAQLGSNDIDQGEFSRRVTLKVIQQIIPIALRSAAKMVPAREVALNAAATACEVATDFATAKLAIGRARDVSALARPTYAADAATYAAAAAATYAAAAARLKVLRMTAAIGVSVLKEMNCKGTQWLWLTENNDAACTD